MSILCRINIYNNYNYPVRFSLWSPNSSVLACWSNYWSGAHSGCLGCSANTCRCWTESDLPCTRIWWADGTTAQERKVVGRICTHQSASDFSRTFAPRCWYHKPTHQFAAWKTENIFISNFIGLSFFLSPFDILYAAQKTFNM